MRSFLFANLFLFIFSLSLALAREEDSVPAPPKPPQTTAPAPAAPAAPAKKEKQTTKPAETKKKEEKKKTPVPATTSATPTPAPTPVPAPSPTNSTKKELSKEKKNETSATSSAVNQTKKDKTTESNEKKKSLEEKSLKETTEKKPKDRQAPRSNSATPLPATPTPVTPTPATPDKKKSPVVKPEAGGTKKDREEKEDKNSSKTKKTNNEKKAATKEVEEDPADLIKKGTETISGKNSQKLGEIPKKPCCDVTSTKEDKEPKPKQDLGSAAFELKLKFDTESSCKKASKIYLPGLKQIPDTFRAKRDDYVISGADVSPVCVQTVMNNMVLPASLLAVCTKNSGLAKRKGSKSCMTEDYFYSIYNSFLDVTDCFGISQKGLLPKLSNESGMHLNALGGGGDIGVGQLTEVAIKDANNNWETYLSQVKNSSKKSCSRIAPMVPKFGKSKPMNANCGLIMPPDNPLKNVYYIGVVTARNRDIVESTFDDFDISKSLKDAGIDNEGIKKIKEMVTMLGYNAGAGSAAILLNNFLKKKKEFVKKGKKLTLDASAFDFSVSTDKVKIGCRAAVKKYGKDITFPQYAKACQGAGTNGYLSKVFENKTKIDKTAGAGICTDEKFLQL